MDTTILLIRHARHADYGLRLSGRSETPLTAIGLRQADALAERLDGRDLAAVQTSPRKRAVETAAAIAKVAGVAAESHAALDEIEFAGWSERSFLALDADPAWRAWNTVRGTARPPGGESQGEAAERALAHIERQARETPGATVAMVTHCDVIRGVVCRVLGLPFDKLLRFDIDAASVSTLIVRPGHARVAGLNEGGNA